MKKKRYLHELDCVWARFDIVFDKEFSITDHRRKVSDTQHTSLFTKWAVRQIWVSKTNQLECDMVQWASKIICMKACSWVNQECSTLKSWLAVKSEGGDRKSTQRNASHLIAGSMSLWKLQKHNKVQVFWGETLNTHHKRILSKITVAMLCVNTLPLEGKDTTFYPGT